MERQTTATITKPRPMAPEGDPEIQPGKPPKDGNGHSPAPDYDHDEIDMNVPKPKAGWIIAVSAVGALVLAVLLTVGWWQRTKATKQLAADAYAALNAPVPVTVVKPHRANATIDVSLPGTLRPWQEVSLFARVSGYLTKYRVDISSVVRQGDIMADIDSPETDQQYAAAFNTLELQKANERTARTQLKYADDQNDRYQKLKGTSGVTELQLAQFQSAADSAKSAFESAQSGVKVAENNLALWKKNKSFEQIVAPFDGVVTARAFYSGGMILANPTATDTPPLFKIADNSSLRCFINVPQSYALTIEQGMQVTVTAREKSGNEYFGQVLGTTNYLDLNARSLLTEVKIDNSDLIRRVLTDGWRAVFLPPNRPDGRLLPGMFVQATFHVTRDNPPLVIPAAALVINADGKQVAVIRDNKVHFKTVQLGVDFGSEIEILSGLEEDDQVIGNPAERTVEGVAVQAAGEKKSPSDAAEKVEANRFRTLPMDPTTLTIRQFQKHIFDRYEKTDRARGTPGTWLHFSEEIGELARALARNDRANLEEEFADVVAWLCTLANINDVDLAASVARKYLGEKPPEGTK